jgi:hypothetical protein
VLSIELTRLVGYTEIAAALHANRTTVMGWHRRRHSDSDVIWDQGTGFPEDLWTQYGLKPLSLGPLYDLRQVVEWYVNWESPRNVAKGLPKHGYVEQSLLDDLGIDLGIDIPKMESA